MRANDQLASVGYSVAIGPNGPIVSPSPDPHQLQAPVNIYGADGVSIENYITIEGGKTIQVGAGHGQRAVAFQGVYEVGAQPSGLPWLVFNFNPAININTNVRTVRNSVIYRVGGVFTYKSAAVAPSDGGPFIGYDYNPTFADDGSGGSATLADIRVRNVQGTYSVAWNITKLAVDNIMSPAGVGVIATMVVYEIADFGARVTTPITLRSAGALPQMRHRGPGVFGANAAPTSAQCVLEVQSTTQAFLPPRMTNAQIATMTALGIPDGAQVYCTDVGVLPVGMHQRLAGAWAAM